MLIINVYSSITNECSIIIVFLVWLFRFFAKLSIMGLYYVFGVYEKTTPRGSRRRSGLEIADYCLQGREGAMYREFSIYTSLKPDGSKTKRKYENVF
jgi:hypothetical protein